MADTEVIDQPAPAVEISDEQFLTEIEKRTGSKFENFDTVKEKLTYQPPPPAPTDTEKEESNKQLQKRMLEVHLNGGGKIEDFTRLSAIAKADLKELSHNKAVIELKEAGFTDDQAKEIMKERYFQLDDNDIELEEDEDKKAFLKKSKDVFSKKLDTKASHIQQQAKSYIDSLTKAVQDSDAEKKRMEQHTSNVEDAIKNYQRKQTLELGKVDDTDIPPIEHEVPEDALTEVKELLKDPVKFEQLLFNKEGDVNLDFIIPHLVRSTSYKNAIKHSYLVGGTRQVEHFEAAFGSSVPNLGGQPKPDNTVGKPVRRGKSEFVAPST